MTIDTGVINAPSSIISVGGVTLSEFRQRLRIQLSSYASGTLISNSNPDTELQFINDGIGQLWQTDFQIVNHAIAIVSNQSQYWLPPDCEHVFSVFYSDKDAAERKGTVRRIPAYDGWTFDPTFVSAIETNLEDGTTWTDDVKKVLNIELWQLGLSQNSNQQIDPSRKFLIVRYARRWPALSQETDSIDPSPNRIQAIIYFACAQWFKSQFEVNSESIRYRNYIELSNQMTQMALQQLNRDPKQLFIV